MFRYSSLKSQQISLKISLTILLISLLTFTLLMAVESSIRLEEFKFSSLQSVRNNIDLLEAVHVQSMLHRQKTSDNDPAINVLNGTFIQLSTLSNGTKYWLVMSEKVVAYQVRNGFTEIEKPVDDIDRFALESKQERHELSDKTLRYTRPVVLGQGSAKHPLCFECHRNQMGIKEGEVIGAYSTSVDLSKQWQLLQQELIILAAVLFLIALLLWFVIHYLLQKIALKRLSTLNHIATELSVGNFNLKIQDSEVKEKDEISQLFATMREFKENARQRFKAEQAIRQLNLELEDKVERRTHELLLAKNTAEAANRVKSEFLASMSHELRTPLNAILGFTQLLELEDMPPDQADSLHHIRQGGEYLLIMINDVLDFAKIEAHELTLDIKTHCIYGIIKHCCDTIQILAAKRKISLDISCDKDIRVLADTNKLQQVLLNLLSNAVKYNHDNGHISVTCAVTASNRIRVTVTDTGQGIPSELTSGLFKPFSRLGQENSNIPGTGLGLSITQHLIEAMKGHIDYQSTPGQGSSFWLELPIPTKDNPPS